MAKSSKRVSWWSFAGSDKGPATGEFSASGWRNVGPLYFPLANEAGMLSWVSPSLQGGPAQNHHAYLGLPQSIEDLPHSLVHRGFWLAEKGRAPFSLSDISPDGLKGGGGKARVQAGLGWFKLSRKDTEGRFEVSATCWCPADFAEKIEVMLVEVTNTSRRRLHLRPYAAIPCFARSADNVRDHRHVTALLHRVEVSASGVTVCPTMSFDERGHKVNRIRYSVLGFGPGAKAPAAVWGSQEDFLGRGGNFAAPAAVWESKDGPEASAATLQGREAIGGFRFDELRLAPGSTARFVLISGISDDPAAVRRWTKWGGSAAVRKSLEFTRRHWMEHAGRIAFSTPDRALDNWLTWVGFQPTLRRLYGNSYLPHFDYGRGGKGWRDLWQDCLALLLSNPKSTRAMLLHNFGGVRIDGSNATIIGGRGEFIADRNNIPRTWMDHGAWPTYTTLLYVDQTGDLDFVLAPREYFRDPQTHRCRVRDAGWTEAYGYALRTRGGEVYRGSLFEHMLVQNLAAFFNVGGHNVCRLEGADWNDGLDMAHRQGESVAFTAFYAWNLDRLADLAESLAARGEITIALAREMLLLLDRLPGGRRVNYGSAKAKRARLEEYLDTVARDVSGARLKVRMADLVRDLRAKSLDLGERIRKQEWVRAAGQSFFNGYYDDKGRRVEGVQRGRVRMTLTGQVFPVMSGIATDGQVEQVAVAVNRFLRDGPGGGVRLNTDFGGIQPELGRAFSFAYGEKENGAVFSHMAVMYAFAMYQRRRPDLGRAAWLSLYQLATAGETARILPCLPEYFNAERRGLYAYLTGSASWLIYLLLTQIYGVRGERGDLVLDPQLARDDFDVRGECAVRLPFAGRPLHIVFRNAARLAPGRYRVESVVCAGRPLAVAGRSGTGVRIARSVVESLPAGRETRFVVTLGRV